MHTSIGTLLSTIWIFVLPMQANAIGRSAKTVREFLEKNYTEEAIAGDNEAIKLAIKALLEVRTGVFNDFCVFVVLYIQS